MRRRRFIFRLLTSLSSLIIFSRNILASVFNLQLEDQFLEIVIPDSEEKKRIRIINIADEKYISVEEFAQVLHYGIYTNENKKKSVLYLVNDRLTFTAGNTFIIVNDNMVQVLFPCHWYQNSVAVQISSLAFVLNKYTPVKVNFDQDIKEISLRRADINITGIRISPRENGTMIHVISEKKFENRDVILDIRNGWLHIDIFGGKIDTTSIANTLPAGIVRKIDAFQLDETASIALKLKAKILAKDIVFQQDSDNFYVNLRTSDKIGNESKIEETNKELDEKKKKWFVDTIVLDAGHGGKDPGAVGYGKVKEKDIALPIVLKLGEIIKRNMPNVRVIYTRNKDVFIPLWQRTKIANESDGKLFISVHCNSNTNKSVKGFETYFLSADKDEKATGVVLKENSVIEFEETTDKQKYEGLNFILATMAQSAFIKQSQYLASVIQNSLRNKMEKSGMRSRGVKQGPFWVMVGATMPNVLIETGYISNKSESLLLKKSTTQKKLAEAIFEGIKTYKRDIESVI